MADYLKVNTLEDETEVEREDDEADGEEDDISIRGRRSISSSNRNQNNVLISKPPSQPRDVAYSSVYLLLGIAMVCFTVFKREEPLSNAIVSTKYAGK